MKCLFFCFASIFQKIYNQLLQLVGYGLDQNRGCDESFSKTEGTEEKWKPWSMAMKMYQERNELTINLKSKIFENITQPLT